METLIIVCVTVLGAILLVFLVHGMSQSIVKKVYNYMLENEQFNQ